MGTVYELIQPSETADSKFTDGGIPAARKNAVSAEEKAAHESKISRLASEIRAQHDWVDDCDVMSIMYRLESDKACQNCKGYPCEKGGLQNVIEYDDWQRRVNFSTKFCALAKAARKQKQLNRNFEKAQIPRRYIGKTFEDYDVDADNEIAVEWAKAVVEGTEECGLLMYGTPGSGKTFLAAIIAQELIRQGRGVIFGDVPSILQDLKAGFGTEGAYEAKLGKLEEADMLILDDVGTEYGTDWANSQLYTIVNNRYNKELPVIVTTNYEAGELAGRFKNNINGARIISRLRQMCVPIQLGGGDRRTNYGEHD